MDDVSALSPGEMLAIQSWLSFYGDNYDPVGEWFWQGEGSGWARVGQRHGDGRSGAQHCVAPGFGYIMSAVERVLHLCRWRQKPVSDQLELLLNQT